MILPGVTGEESLTETIPMNDLELLQEFLRVEHTESGVRILVRRIHWNGPAEPVSIWVVGKDFHSAATKAETDAAARRILEDERYFRVCGECGERNPLGWMHDETMCQGCASKNRGIVY